MSLSNMKKIILLICLNFLMLASSFAQTDVYDSVLVGTDWRTYNIHFPKGYTANGKYPLILGFHGGQQAGRTELGWQALPSQSRLSEKADKEGFMVVYPEGKEFVTGRSWNAGNCCPPSSSRGVDDVAFVNSLLNKLFSNYPIDTTRVYATGTSNGGMFCYRLACELSHRISAIAPNVASHMYQPCNPAKKIPIISFNSKIDPVVPYNGGFGPSTVTFLRDVYFPSQDSVLRIWSGMNNCMRRDTVINGQNNNYDFIKLSNCTCNVEVHHYATTDGGHSWPGGVPNDVSPVSTQINATDLLWSFFQNYTLGCLTTGVQNINEPKKTQTFPNPFTNKINLTHKTGKEKFTLINYFGQIIWTGKNIEEQDFSNLSNGTYFLRINHRTIKVVKQ
jgi:polyhydroxybutyrate depolymerase